MPYKTISQLPDSVKDNLPKHAQEIYKGAFNSAWEQYDHDDERSHKIAWGAVKQEYEKDEDSGKWKKK